uniref:Uncharacterized protein n=1 Tax=Candidatus Kentrum sp. LFY TaxID=2126342 RepID=A0A450UES4_9GAMM|nr:MAG: hypothetical protein BECKLFY1418A_GA0070994_101413 [Candidatus Kentron sp. LFY]
MQLSPVLFSILGPLTVPLIYWLHRNYKILLAAKTGDEEKNRRLANDREHLRAMIEGRRFEERYRHLLGHFLDGLARLTRDTESIESSAARDSGVVRLFGIDPFTENSYKLCLRLALLYPIMGFFLGWVLGGTGDLAGVELLPAEVLWRRWLLLGGMVLLGWLWFKLQTTEGRIRWVYLVGVVVVAFAFADAFAFSLAFVFAAAGAVGFAVAVTVAVTVAVAFVWLRGRLDSRRGIIAYWLGFNLFSVLYLAAAFAWTLPRLGESDIAVLLVPTFLGLLPLANAALDWLSLGVTRGFLYAIHRGHHPGVVALSWGLLDIVLALLFLFGIVSLTTFVVAGLDAITLAWGGRDLLDLGALFGKLESSPWSLDVAWIHFMMLSTLVPTLVHFFIAGSAAVLILPDGWRDRILANFDRSDDARWWAFLYVSFVPPLAVVAPAALLWGLYHLITTHHGMIGGWLLDWARWVASVVDPSFSATQAGQWLVFWQG